MQGHSDHLPQKGEVAGQADFYNKITAPSRSMPFIVLFISGASDRAVSLWHLLNTNIQSGGWKIETAWVNLFAPKNDRDAALPRGVQELRRAALPCLCIFLNGEIIEDGTLQLRSAAEDEEAIRFIVNRAAKISMPSPPSPSRWSKPTTSEAINSIQNRAAKISLPPPSRETDNSQSPQSPEDCLRHCRNSLTSDQYKLATLMIKLYGLKQAMNFAEGEWIEETAARSGAETEQQRIMMIIEEGLTFLQAWLAKVPRTLDQGDAVGMMIGMRAHQKYNLSPEIVLGTLISQADEETIASALKYGRAAREDEKPKNFLRLVHSSSPGNPE